MWKGLALEEKIVRYPSVSLVLHWVEMRKLSNIQKRRLTNPMP